MTIHHNRFIAHVHEYIRVGRLARRGAAGYPTTAPQGECKDYPRMERIVLPAPRALPHNITDILVGRRSASDCKDTAAVALADLGDLLGHALGLCAGERRRYPSGGTLYPIETYLFIKTLTGLTPGIYHYQPRAHALERLWPLPDESTSRWHTMPHPFITKAPILIIFTSVWGRSAVKYGDFAFELALLEAGHMSQNVLLVATALSLTSRPFAAFDDAVISELLDLNPDYEQPILTIGLAGPAKSGYGKPLKA